MGAATAASFKASAALSVNKPKRLHGTCALQFPGVLASSRCIFGLLELLSVGRAEDRLNVGLHKQSTYISDFLRIYLYVYIYIFIFITSVYLYQSKFFYLYLHISISIPVYFFSICMTIPKNGNNMVTCSVCGHCIVQAVACPSLRDSKATDFLVTDSQK